MVELHTPEHRAWVQAENEKLEAQNELNAAAKAFNRAYQRWDAANRYAKKLKERVRKRLQKRDQ